MQVCFIARKQCYHSNYLYRRFEKKTNRKQFKRNCEVIISKLDVISYQQYAVWLN